MPIKFNLFPEGVEPATIDDIQNHLSNCSNIEAVDERLRNVENEVVIARFAGYSISKIESNYQITLNFTGNTTEDYIFTQGTEYTAVSGTYVVKSSITTYTVTLTPEQVSTGELLEMKRVIDIAIMYQLIVDAAFVGSGNDGSFIETDPIWNAEKLYYVKPIVLESRIATHDQNTLSHGGVQEKVEGILPIIPSTATETNKLITKDDLQSGLESVFVDGPVIYQDSLATYDDLLAVQNPERGWWFEVLSPDDKTGFYIWNGTEWKPTSGIIGVQDFYKKPEVDALIAAESASFESEIKKILDDYAAEHDNDKNEWISIFPSTNILVGSGTFTLDKDLKEVGATEIIVFFRMGGVAIPHKTATCYLPITSEFVPQASYMNYAGSGTTYNGGGVYYRGIVTDSTSPGEQDTGPALATFYFTSYNTIQVNIGPFGYISGVFYRSAKTNTAIQYYKDPSILVTGNQSPDWSKVYSVFLNGTPYLPVTSDGTNVITGDPYIIPDDGYLYVILTLRNPRLVYTTVEMRINGNRVSLWSSRIPSETTSDDYRSISAYARVNKGDQLTIAVDYRYAGTIPWNGVYNNIYVYGLEDTEVVDDTVAEAFNQHTQNTDIHVTADEKLDIGKIPEILDRVVSTSAELDVTTDIANQANLNITEHTKADAELYANMYATLYKDILQAAKDVYAGTTPALDMSAGQVIIGTGSVLTLNVTGETWTTPSNGAVVITYKALILGVAPTATKNGVEVFGSGLSLLGLGSGNPVQIKTDSGDQWVFSGSLGLLDSFNATFYPNAPI